jgi:chromate reductase
MSDLKIVTICGSLRKGSYNAALLNLLPGLAPESFKFAPAPRIDGIPHYNADVQNETGVPAEVRAWADAIRSADGIIIASPEYNWTIPGTLKNAVDWVSRMPDQPFKSKPVALQSASIALLGGSRMQYHMRQCLVSIDAHVIGRPEVIITFANRKFENGELKDPQTLDIIRQQLAAFETYVRRFKT